MDFSQSIQRGISAAQEAKRNREEVTAVFDELNAQLNHVSKGTSAIKVVDFEEPRPGAAALGLSAFFEPTKRYRAVAVVHKFYKQFAAKEIARWKQDPAGYPCWITTRDAEMACENKEGLEAALDVLLSSPTVGEKLVQAMNYIPAGGAGTAP